MKIAITGSSGMLGSALVKELQADHQLLEIDLKNGHDITKKKIIDDEIKKFSPDLIIHAAAMTDVDGCELDPDKAKDVNVQGTKNIVDAARQAKLIYISTDYVFDGEFEKRRPYKETDAPKPISVYGQTKLDGEKCVRGLIDYLIIRTSWLFGPNGNNFVKTIINLAEKHKELNIVEDQFGIPTYAPSLAKAIADIINKLNDESFNELYYHRILHLTNDGSEEKRPPKDPSVSWWKFAWKILEIAEISVKVNKVESKDIRRSARRPKNSKLMSSDPNRPKMPHWEKELKSYVDYLKGKAK